MKAEKTRSRLDAAMTLLGVKALRLSDLCGISNSMISRLQAGVQPLSERNEALLPLVDALLKLDEDERLLELLAPWRTGGESKADALRLFLTDEPIPALPARAAPPKLQKSGSYILEQQVLLGARGFRKGSLLMLDYLMKLPPGQRVIICAHSGFEMWHGSVSFALQFVYKMNRAVGRGAQFTLVNRNAPGVDGSPWFSVFWLASHLKGIIRSRFYDGEPPEEYFVGVIPGYWSGRAEPDDTAEDDIIGFLSTDPRHIRRDEAHCAEYLKRSRPASQYGFLRNPQGEKRGDKRWKRGHLPAWDLPGAAAPDGCFSAICRTPSFGVMTEEEFSLLCGGDTPPPIPDYLFSENGGFAAGPHRIILCRDDVREGLQGGGRNEPLSRLLGRDVRVPREMLAAQMERLLAAMKERRDFEVALMPRVAFAKLELELIYWHNSAGLCWLQDGGESMFDADPLVAGSFASAADYTWGRLRPGWKQRDKVMKALRGWLAGKGLDKAEEDSTVVKNWDVLPKK